MNESGMLLVRVGGGGEERLRGFLRKSLVAIRIPRRDKVGISVRG